jgi:excisionase family DNA binding protein
MPSAKPVSLSAVVPTVLTPDEVADLLSIRRDLVIKHAREGKIPSFKIGKAVRFRLPAIEQWLQEQERT